jgi:hypothetical protein
VIATIFLGRLPAVYIKDAEEPLVDVIAGTFAFFPESVQAVGSRPHIIPAHWQKKSVCQS